MLGNSVVQFSKQNNKLCTYPILFGCLCLHRDMNVINTHETEVS